MAGAVLIILLIALAIFLIINFLRHLLTSTRILKEFKKRNVIITGAQGYGKDVLTAYVISKDGEHLSNVPYNDKSRVTKISELELSPNDYNNFISGNVTQITKNDFFEGKNYYLSDGGVHLPSQMDSVLHKKYPSLPITYALYRQLYNGHIHVNVQRIERLWKAIREQADYFIDLRKPCLKLPFFIVLFTTEYDKYESARMRLSPLNSLIFNKYSKADKQKYKAQNGFIKSGLLIVPKWKLKYDTRAFHEVIFNKKAPKGDTTIWLTLFNKLKSITKKAKK